MFIFSGLCPHYNPDLTPVLCCILIFRTHTCLVVAGYRSQCFFPRPWHGEYFHLGYSAPLEVVNSSISGKGRCVENFGSHFVMEDEEYGERCWRCMTMYRKHQNVLSYKESKYKNISSMRKIFYRNNKIFIVGKIFHLYDATKNISTAQYKENIL